MRKINVFTILFSLFCLVVVGKGIQAISIDVIGNWSETIDSSDLQYGAGSDLNPTYTSAPDLISIGIRVGTPKDWRVNVRKVDTNWPAAFQLSVKRTGPGTGKGSIMGGTSWLEVDSSWQEFFIGKSKRDDIPVQLELAGVSVQIPPGTYITTIYYEVEEI